MTQIYLFIYLNSMTEALMLSGIHRIAFGDLSMQNNTAHYENINEFRELFRIRGCLTYLLPFFAYLLTLRINDS